MGDLSARTPRKWGQTKPEALLLRRVLALESF